MSELSRRVIEHEDTNWFTKHIDSEQDEMATALAHEVEAAESRALAAEKEKDAAVAEVKRVRDLIDRDRTGLAAGLDGVRQILRGWAWLAEPDNWGSYSYEDHNTSTLRKEVAALLREAHAVIANAMKDSGRRADSAFYPEHPDRSATIDALRSERDAALAKLAEVERELYVERGGRIHYQDQAATFAAQCRAIREAARREADADARVLALYRDTLSVIANHPDNTEALTWIRGKAQDALDKTEAAQQGRIYAQVRALATGKGAG